MRYWGTIVKMKNMLENPVQYVLPIGEDMVPMNELIGKYILFKWERQINLEKSNTILVYLK